MHETVELVTSGYLAQVDEALPGRVEGLYLVGSTALDDFRPGQSDIDFVAVTADPLAATELDELARVHSSVRRRWRRPWFDGIYVTWDALAGHPGAAGPVPFAHERRFAADEAFEANPIQWLTLATHPLAVRGPDTPTVWTDDESVRSWCLDNLGTYWAGWVRRERRLTGPRGLSLSDWGVAWGVLGVARLRYTLLTGWVTSKSGAGDHALGSLDESWHPIVHEALRIRRDTGEPSGYRHRFARRRNALAFMEMVIAAAGARPPRRPHGRVARSSRAAHHRRR